MRQLHCLVYRDNFCLRRCDVTFCVSSNQRQHPNFGRSTQASEGFVSGLPLPFPLPLGRPDTQASYSCKAKSARSSNNSMRSCWIWYIVGLHTDTVGSLLYKDLTQANYFPEHISTKLLRLVCHLKLRKYTFNSMWWFGSEKKLSRPKLCRVSLVSFRYKVVSLTHR